MKIFGLGSVIRPGPGNLVAENIYATLSTMEIHLKTQYLCGDLDACSSSKELDNGAYNPHIAKFSRR